MPDENGTRPRRIVEEIGLQRFADFRFFRTVGLLLGSIVVDRPARGAVLNLVLLVVARPERIVAVRESGLLGQRRHTPQGKKRSERRTHKPVSVSRRDHPP